MVLCNIYITAGSFINASTPTLVQTNVFGRKKVKILKIDYVENSVTDKMIQIQSNFLRIPYGNSPWLQFTNNAVRQIGNIHNDIIFETDMNGNMDIFLFDVVNNSFPLGFLYMSILLDITDL